MTSTKGRLALLRADVRGRVRRSAAQRAEILAAFDKSGVSAAEFARLVGGEVSDLGGLAAPARTTGESAGGAFRGGGRRRHHRGPRRHPLHRDRELPPPPPRFLRLPQGCPHPSAHADQPPGRPHHARQLGQKPPRSPHPRSIDVIALHCHIYARNGGPGDAYNWETELFLCEGLSRPQPHGLPSSDVRHG